MFLVGAEYTRVSQKHRWDTPQQWRYFLGPVHTPVKIRLTHKFADVIDDIDLSGRHVGDIIDVPQRQGRILIAEGWAEGTFARGPHPVVLVVEDDAQLREHYRAGLGGRFVVDVCVDGLAALAYFDHQWPDAVVLDLNLPGVHGQAVYNELQHQPLTAAIPIVVVTGVDPPPELPGALVLRKPCGIDELMGALERAMGRHSVVPHP